MGSVQWADIKFHLLLHIFICIIIPIIINHIAPKCVFLGECRVCSQISNFMSRPVWNLSMWHREKVSLSVLPDFFCSRPVKISSHCQSGDISGTWRPKYVSNCNSFATANAVSSFIQNFFWAHQDQERNILFLRGERYIETIASLDQWSMTIENHWNQCTMLLYQCKRCN